ncbi:helix-turn-helix domain-containing protein [Runella slithyformis]|nr:AraC family transcriptional regulator [Runella slithyformis]
MPYYFSFEGNHLESFKNELHEFISSNGTTTDNCFKITAFFEQLPPRCHYLQFNILTNSPIEFSQKIATNIQGTSDLLICFFDGNHALNIQIGESKTEISTRGVAIVSHKTPFNIQLPESYKGFLCFFSISAKGWSQHLTTYFTFPCKLLPISALNIHYIHQLRAELFIESGKVHLERTIVINQLLYQFLSELITDFRQVNNNNSIEQVKQLLLTNLSTPLPPLEKLAQLCNMSVSTFRARFQQNTGSSAKKFFYDAQMNFATRLLSEGFSTKEIANRLGYANASNFIHAFKRKFGVSPLKHK